MIFGHHAQRSFDLELASRGLGKCISFFLVFGVIVKPQPHIKKGSRSSFFGGCGSSYLAAFFFVVRSHHHQARRSFASPCAVLQLYEITIPITPSDPTVHRGPPQKTISCIYHPPIHKDQNRAGPPRALLLLYHHPIHQRPIAAAHPSMIPFHGLGA